MGKPINVVIQGATNISDVPGLHAFDDGVRFHCAANADQLQHLLPSAQVLLGWNFQSVQLAQAWSDARQLQWIHWSGAGVDALLFPELIDSDVVVTNARGIFDVPMAEYTLGLILAMAKGFVQTFADQQQQQWNHRTAQSLQGRQVLIVGVGSIGRSIARMLKAVGMQVRGVGRTARAGDTDFGNVHAVDELDGQLPLADYVVLITPLTQHTRGLFDAARFARMREDACFINLGRGALIDDEGALVDALRNNTIAGAALDVFQHEPLPKDSPLWHTPNLIVSPHMSGDLHDFETLVADQFIDNLRRFCCGDELLNVVDKRLGFVAG
ncbi:MAG: phosphoglycerate dehydrogenase-like enzyme [Gammaproteobacteria bacterium]|jgi:phosphoglycerate dehydrogenase-like enzyme